MPARVEPVDDADTVEFPWDRAEAAVAALNRVASTLGDQLTVRHQMLPTVSDWEGAYRREFDDKYRQLTGNAPFLAERLRLHASAIVSAAEAANQDQRVKNSMADSTLLPPLGGRR